MSRLRPSLLSAFLFVSSVPAVSFQCSHCPCARYAPPVHDRPTEAVLPVPRPVLELRIIVRFRLDVECLVPGVDIARGADDALARRAVLVARDLLPDRIVARLVAPRLRKGEDETLVAGQSVDRRRRLAAERAVIGVIGD